MQAKVNSFFESNPEAQEVHAALGKLFLNKDDATAYKGGTSAEVETFQRGEQEGKPAEKLENGDAEKQPGTEKEALSPEELEEGHNKLLTGEQQPQVKEVEEKAPDTKTKNTKSQDKKITGKS